MSTKRDIYAHSAFMSELETALSVSFSFNCVAFASRDGSAAGRFVRLSFLYKHSG